MVVVGFNDQGEVKIVEYLRYVPVAIHAKLKEVYGGARATSSAYHFCDSAKRSPPWQ